MEGKKGYFLDNLKTENYLQNGLMDFVKRILFVEEPNSKTQPVVENFEHVVLERYYFVEDSKITGN